jgi:large subunit ribosomal protein L24
MAKKLQFVTEAVKKARYKLELQRKSLINLPPTEQALLRRAILVKNQKIRRKALQDSKDRSDRYKDFRESQNAKWKVYWEDVRNERKTRREDWLMGPLAPVRDSGLQKNTYGATTPRRLMAVEPLEEDKIKHVPFMKGDRVVVTSGRERGKIGKISMVHDSYQAATVEGIAEVTHHS